MSVNFATADGATNPATAGSDYAAQSGRLTFAPNETSKTTTVQVNGDSLAESNETFFVNLSNAVNATIADGQGVGTITDDDSTGTGTGALQLSSATYSVNEDGLTITITVTRTGGSDGAVAVDYATSNGSALSPGDYATTSGTLAFAAGETAKSFTITIIDDLLGECAETINITLNNATGGATLGVQKTALLTLNDDDVIQ